jgi:hypothetical protein
LGASGMIDGLPADVRTRFDEHLGATFVAERAATYRGQASRTRKRRPVDSGGWIALFSARVLGFDRDFTLAGFYFWKPVVA